MNRQQIEPPLDPGWIAVAFCLALLAASHAHAQTYRLERIASGLAQPTYLAQAPGDPPNIVYYSTRITAANGTGGGFGTLNNMGGIYRYDMSTRTSNLVMSLSHRQLTGDEGLVGFAFSPDFNTPGAPGYQKIFVSSSQFTSNSTSPIDRVEEYDVSGPGGTVPLDPNGRPVVNRLILEYTHVNAQQNHTVDWIGFDPVAHSLPVGAPERNYLYVVTGDGALGASAQNRPEQKANAVAGKLLRVDVDVAGHGDFYPSDPLKNFAIPPTNPIPLWNSTHPAGEQLVGTTLAYTTSPMSATYSPALPEIYFTGMRNTFRMSFDRQTSDIWMGDVGEGAREEINFLKANPYDGAQPPIDFGYAQREGTIATGAGLGVSGSSGATTLQWNLSGGGSVVVDSVNPIREGPHTIINTPDEIKTTPRSSYIGGYVYRGPIAELDGRYFYTDFAHGNIWALDFDRETPLESYSGTNFNQDPVTGLASLGTRTTVLTRDLNSLWHTRIVDPADPTYTPALGAGFGIGRVVSFAEDNAGNLYIIDFGGTRGDPGFGNDYPHAGRGQIFVLRPALEIVLSINRDTGEIALQNQTTGAVDVLSYSVSSASGAIDPTHLIPVTGNYDASPTGDRSIDDNDPWQITSPSGSRFQLAEQTTGDAGRLAAGSSSPLGISGAWTQSIYEDLRLSLRLANGSTVPGFVEFTGNGGHPFFRSDLNFNGVLDPADWPLFRMNHLATFSSLSVAESYRLGDLDGDGDNDFTDFRLFQADYIAANGEAAFAALLNVPEPATSALALAIFVAVLGARLLGFRRWNCDRRRASLFKAGLGWMGFAPSPLRGGLGRGLSGVRPFNFHQRSRPCGGRRLVLGATFAGLLVTSSARAGLRHRYSFNEGATGNATGRTIFDSIGGANGTVIGPLEGGGLPTATATQLVLPGGEMEVAPYVDLPNGLASSLTNATFEGWYTQTGAQAWARIFDFGSTAGGELTGPGGGGEGRDYIFFAASRGTNINQQRGGMRNNDPLFLGSEAGTVAGAEALADSNIAYTLGTQRHVAVVFNSTGGSGATPASLTVFIDGIQRATTNTTIQLRNLNDVNNWLGRSNWTGDDNFAGSLNEFRIYDVALSASQVDASFDAGPNVVPDFGVISLEVNTVTGRLKIKNSGSTPTNIDYYRITSAAGSLDTANWNSLDDQNRDAIGTGAGESWDEAELSNSFTLAELFLLGASGLSSTSPLDLGHAYDPSILGAGTNGDLQFHFAAQGSNDLTPGAVTYVTTGPLAGDYNGNGTVDAADYVIWRKTLGSTTALAADGDDNGRVDEYDYAVWRFTFGNSAGTGSIAANSMVPEPRIAALLMGMCLWSVFKRTSM